MAVTLDYDNGMLNKRPRSFTFLYQVTSHRHGTIGEVYNLNESAYRALNSRFGYYTTSKGVGFFGVEYDYDNGMLNKRPRYHIQTMAPLAMIQQAKDRPSKTYDPALAITPQAKALACQPRTTMITAC